MLIKTFLQSLLVELGAGVIPLFILGMLVLNWNVGSKPPSVPHITIKLIP